MRTVLIALGAAALATPALALTISPAPNRDAQPHLQQNNSSAGQGADIRDSWLSSDRPRTGLSYGVGASDYTDAPRYRYAPIDPARRFDPRRQSLSPTGADLQRLTPRR